MDKIKKFWKAVYNLLDDVLAFILTLACTMFASIVPLLNSGEKLVVDLSWPRLIGSALVAFLLTLWQEYNKPDEEGSTIKSKEGKRKHFLKRMIYAMIFGFASPMIMEKLIALVNIG